jgi:hypothetical protein
LIGHGSQRLWQALTEFGMKTADPVDHFSLVMPRRFTDEFPGVPPVLMLYPTDDNIPLQRLGALAGWPHLPPLGINGTCALWFAYRAAFLTTLPLPATQHSDTTSFQSVGFIDVAAALL